jgi:Domain of unknown function (DUF4157)
VSGTRKHRVVDHPKQQAARLQDAPVTDVPAEKLASAVGNRSFAGMVGRLGDGVIPGGAIDPSVSRAIASARGTGRSIEGDVREYFALRLGDELSDVRVHDDPEADSLSRAIGARAFTTGSDIFFAENQYRPGTIDGEQLLAHELAHVVQGRGLAAGEPTHVSDPGDATEVEADAVAKAVTVGEQSIPSTWAEEEVAAPWPTPVPKAGQMLLTQRGVVQRKAETVTFEPELVLSLNPGTTPSEFIQNQVNLMKESLNIYWANYRDGLMGFQTSMEFASEQEAESKYLNTALKAVAKVDLDLFLEGVVEGCPELGIPIKMAKEIITSELEEYERVEKAEGQVKIVEFIDKTRNAIGPTSSKALDALNKQVRPMQSTYAQLARDSDDDKGGPSNVVSGPGAHLLSNLESSQKRMRQRVEQKPAPVFQEEFTESFAAVGASQVGPITAGNYQNATMYLTLRMYRNEKGAYSVKSIGDYWELKTNAPNPDKVASSLDRALKAQGREPVECALTKIVRATLEIESGHFYESNDYDDTSYQFTDIDDVFYNTADAVLHGNNPGEFREAWDAVAKEKVKGVKKLKGSGA